MFRHLLLLAIAALAGAAALAAAYAARPGFTFEMDRPMPGIVTGFHDIERVGDETYAWSRRQAAMTLPELDRRGAWTCVVHLRGGRPDTGQLPALTVSVDGIVTGRHAATHEAADISIPVAPRIGNGAVLTLDTATFVPGEADKRELGVNVDRWSCAPDPAFTPLPPAPAIRTAAIATTAFGAVLLLMGAPVLVFLAGVVGVAGLQAIPLTRDFGPFSAFALPMEWIAVVLALVMAAMLLVSRAALKRPISAAGNVALFVTVALLYLKLMALFHPSKFIVDALFHAHRLEWVLEGRYFFTQPMPSGVRFPYAIGLYVFAAPWTAFTTDLVSLLRIIVTSAEAVGGLLLYLVIARCWGDRAVAATAALLYALVPRTFEIVGNANMTNAFGQSVALAALVAATLVPLSKGHWKAWPGLAMLFAFALLCHISTLTLLSAILMALVVLYAWVGRPPLRREAWMIAGAFAVAVVLATVLYYGHFGDAFRSAARVRASSAAATSTAPSSAQVSLATRTRDATRISVQSIGWPIVVLAIPGVVVWVRRGWRDRLGLAIAALTVTFFLFAGSVAVMPVEQAFYRYALEFVTRVTLATFPAIVIWAALGAASAWRTGGMARGAGVVLFAAAIVMAGDAWMEWLR